MRRSDHGRHGDDGNGQNSVIEGEDPKESANEEGLEVTRGRTRIKQNAGDQKSRQNEKKIDTRPGTLLYPIEHVTEHAFVSGHAQRVEGDDGQNSDPAKSIEAGQPLVREFRGFGMIRNFVRHLSLSAQIVGPSADSSLISSGGPEDG